MYMWKKILLGFVVVVGFFLWYLWQTAFAAKETITAGMDAQTLYTTRCGICHNGGSAEAPSIEALKVLTEEHILNTLNHGVMKNQAATLSDEQREELAAYISQITAADQANTLVKGLCAEDDTDDFQTTHPRIDDWGLGIENKRYYDQADLKINAKNAGDLTLSWAFAFPNASRARVQPTIAGNTVFTASQVGTIYALNRQTGCTRWTFQADAEIRSALVIGRDSSGRANRLYFWGL